MNLRLSIRAAAAVTIALVGSMAIFAAACGGDDDDNGNGDSAPPTSNAVRPGGSPTSGGQPTAPAPGATKPSSTQPAGEVTTIMTTEVPNLGTILVDAEGMTLYVFANDTANSGTSACTGGCAAAWPALETTSAPTKPTDATGEIDTITLPDGRMQVTYNGLPLYYFVNDQNPGDTLGEGVGGVWSVAKP